MKSSGVPAALAPPATVEGIEMVRERSQSVSHGNVGEERGLTETVTYPSLSKLETFTIITTVTGITVLNSMQNGIVTVGLPTIGRDLQLSSSLILWYPSSLEVLT
jgi:hypothetical protein